MNKRKLFIVLSTAIAILCLITSCNDNTSTTFHSVIFNSDCGTEIAEQIVKHGEKATKPDKPIKSGSEPFNKWVKANGEEFDFDMPITEDTNLKAIYYERKNRIDDLPSDVRNDYERIELVSAIFLEAKNGTFANGKAESDCFDKNLLLELLLALIGKYDDINDSFFIEINGEKKYRSNFAEYSIIEGGKVYNYKANESVPSGYTRKELSFDKLSFKLTSTALLYETSITLEACDFEYQYATNVRDMVALKLQLTANGKKLSRAEYNGGNDIYIGDYVVKIR